MKVRVDTQVCAGFGVCLGICPEVFELHDDGYAVVLVGDVPPESSKVQCAKPSASARHVRFPSVTTPNSSQAGCQFHCSISL
jgi:ferredoxin